MNVSINAKRERGRRNTSHNPFNHSIMKIKTFKNVFQEFPINRIISFLEAGLIDVSYTNGCYHFWMSDCLICVTLLSLNGDDENEKSMTWIGYLLGFLLGASNEFESVFHACFLCKMPRPIDGLSSKYLLLRNIPSLHVRSQRHPFSKSDYIRMVIGFWLVLCMALCYTHNVSTVKRAMDVSVVPFGTHMHILVFVLRQIYVSETLSFDEEYMLYALTLVTTTSVSASVKHTSRAQTVSLAINNMRPAFSVSSRCMRLSISIVPGVSSQLLYNLSTAIYTSLFLTVKDNRN
ncbi:hypothetical protein Tco_0295297 [Tanacetum coccineum]